MDNLEVMVDLDGVLVDYLQRLKTLVLRKISLPVTFDWRIEDMDVSKGLPPWIQERARPVINDLSNHKHVYETALPYAGSHLFIARVLTNFSFLGYVTSRPRKVQVATERWLSNHNFPQPTRVFFADSKTTKLDIMRTNRAEVLVDDSPDVAKEVAPEKTVVLLDKPYNRKVSGVNIVRAYSFADVIEVLGSLKMEKEWRILNANKSLGT